MSIVADIRIALRLLRRRPGLTVTAVLSLGLVTGLLTASFSFANAWLLRPLPYPDAARLVAVGDEPGRARSFNQMDAATYLRIRDAARSFESLVAFREATANLSGPFEATGAIAVYAEPALWSMLRVTPALGRVFSAREAETGAPVVVIGEDLWRTRFSAEPRALGASIRVDGREHTIIGVMPRGFAFHERGALWLPWWVDPSSDETVLVAGRLADGVTYEQARQELALLGDAITAETREPVRLVLRDEMIDRSGTAGILSTLLVAAATFALLVTCANVAGLLLVWATTRRAEMSVRAVLGGCRRRLLRQVLTESAVLGAAGAALGLLIATWSVDLLWTMVPHNMPAWLRPAIDIRVLAFVALVGVVSVLAFGVVPALTATRTGLFDALRAAGTTTASRPTRWIMSALTVAEIAVSFALFTGAALVARSVGALGDAPPGLDPTGVIEATVHLAEARYPDAERVARFHEEALMRLAALPGVRAAAYGFSVDRLRSSPADSTARARLHLNAADSVAADLRGTRPDIQAVSPAWFAVLRRRIVRGRAFTPADGAGSTPVAIVTSDLATRLWPDGDALGRQIRIDTGTSPWITIVGIAGDVRRPSLAPAGATLRTESTVFLPAAQALGGLTRLLIATDPRDDGAMTRIRAAIAELDPDQAVAVAPFADRFLLDRNVLRAIAGLFTGVAAFTLLLALLGVHGIVAWGVVQRRREFGIRMALGAHAADVARMVLRGACRLAAIGVAAGALLSLAANRLLAATLFGIDGVGAHVLAGTAALFAALTLFATWRPVRDAAAVGVEVLIRE